MSKKKILIEKPVNKLMEDLMQSSPPIFRPRPGELVEGFVVFRGKNKLLLDIQGVATGIISGRELRDSFNTFKDLQVGDEVGALVLEEENDEGLVVMSLRMASQRKAWDRFHKLIEGEKTMKFTAQEANKGGLIANIDGIRAFLPVSQLSPVNYPRVNNADAGEIISRLAKFIGHTFTVKIVTMDQEAGKIVVSERDAMAEERAKSLEGLKIGDAKDGIVSGIVKFGLFVTFDGLEGLVHISEIAWGHVKNPAEYAEMGDQVRVLTIGQKVEAQVINIDVDERRIGLSIKALKPIDKETLERMKKDQEEEEKAKASKKEDVEESDDSEASDDVAAEGFVASKDGKKYYAAASAAGKKIKDENRVEFKTAEEAEAAGFAA
jgi:small subunit ribosomal protein S1